MSFFPRVSIIIPVYNGARYLAQAIESAIEQTYANTEIIVVNDGSTDHGATERVVRGYGERIRYVAKENGGVATALNRGIREMTGEYFSWLSHDDLYFPKKIERQIEYAQRFQSGTVLFSDYELIDASNTVIGKIVADHQLLSRKNLYAVLRGAINGLTLLIPRALFQTIGMFREDTQTSNDYALWFDMVRRVRFEHIPEVLVQYRCHPEQGSVTHPLYLREGEALWKGFLHQVTEQEMRALEGTPYIFYQKMAYYLRTLIYRDAVQEALRLAQRSFAQDRMHNTLRFLLPKKLSPRRFQRWMCQ